MTVGRLMDMAGRALAEFGWQTATGLSIPILWPAMAPFVLAGLGRVRNHLSFAGQKQLIGRGQAAVDHALPVPSMG